MINYSMSLGVAMYQCALLFVAFRIYWHKYFVRNKVLSYPRGDQVISVDTDATKKSLSHGGQMTELSELTNRIKNDIIETTRKEIRQSEARQHTKMKTMFNLLKAGSLKNSH